MSSIISFKLLVFAILFSMQLWMISFFTQVHKHSVIILWQLLSLTKVTGLPVCICRCHSYRHWIFLIWNQEWESRMYLSHAVSVAGSLLATRGLELLWKTRSRRPIRPEKARFPNTFFCLLHESGKRFIEDMGGRHARCVTQFAKETALEHCFRDCSQ